MLSFLCSPAHQQLATELLAKNEVRIAVPCAVLLRNPQAAGKRVVRVKAASGSGLVKLECGTWLNVPSDRGFEMDYRQVRWSRALVAAGGAGPGGTLSSAFAAGCCFRDLGCNRTPVSSSSPSSPRTRAVVASVRQ